METLTEKVVISPLLQEASESKSEESYEGLKVVEESAYTGGTSIRYWM